MYALRDFIRVLSLNPADGKLLIHLSNGSQPRKLQEVEIEYLCLNPAVQLNRMLFEVDKMLLTSGTLEPAGDFALLKSSSELDETWKF